jgi:hypothetical protein
MPSIQIHGSGSAAPSASSAASPGAGLEAKQKAAAKEAMQSAVPYLNPKIRAINERLGKWMEAQATKAEAEARASLTSSIPFMNPKIQRLNVGLQRFAEREAQNAYQARVNEFKSNTQTAVKLSNLRQKTIRQEFDARYKEATAENRDRDRRYAQMRRQAEIDNRERDRRIAQMRRASAAEDPNTYRAQNVNRLGLQGARAVDRGNWREMAQAERELSRIEKNHGSNPAVAAAAKTARARISVAKEGQSPLRMRVGSFVGRLMDSPLATYAGGGGGIGGAAEAGLLDNPLTAALVVAYESAKAALKLPGQIAGVSNSLLGPAQPYMNYRKALAGFGRGGQFDSTQLEGLLKDPKSPLSPLGIGPEDAARLLGSYGVAPTSAGGAMGILGAIGGAQNMAYAGSLGHEFYARSAGFAQNLGLTGAIGPGGDQGAGASAYFRNMAKAVGIGVQVGADRAQTWQNIESLLRQEATAGAAVGNGSGVMDLYARSIQGGSAYARSGAAASDLLSASNNFQNTVGLGGDNANVGITASYVDRAGGLKAFASSDDAIKKLLGKSYDALASTPQGKQQLADLRQAAQSGNALMFQNALGPLLAGQPDALNTIFNGSYAADLPGYARTLAAQKFLGVGSAPYANYRATQGAPTGPWDYSKFADKNKQFGLPSGMLESIERIESGGRLNVTSSAGAQGPFQFMPQTWAKYGSGSVWDEDSASTAAGAYLQDNLKRFGGDPLLAIAGYNMNPDTLANIVSAHGSDWLRYTPPETQAYVAKYQAQQAAAAKQQTVASANDVTGINTANARGQQLNMNPSAISSAAAVQALGGPIGTGIVAGSNAITSADVGGINLVGDGLNRAATAVVTGFGDLVTATGKLAEAFTKLANDAGTVHPSRPLTPGSGGDWLLPPSLGGNPQNPGLGYLSSPSKR